ncbi:MAG: Na+/H+ antiporter subunit E [Candidatus Eisenbacteria bacterium]
MRKITLTVFSFIVWFLLVWPFDPVTWDLDIQSTVVGIIVAIFVGLFLGDKIPRRLGVADVFKRVFWLAVYVPMFSWYVIIANLDVLYRVIHPDMPIRPGIVKVRTTLTNPAGRAMLANSITLTPGTMTVDMTDDGYLYVHWINVKSEDIEEATRHIVSKFEGVLRRIFE